MLDLNYYRRVASTEDDPETLQKEFQEFIDEVRQELEELETAANDLLYDIRRSL